MEYAGTWYEHSRLMNAGTVTMRSSRTVRYLSCVALLGLDCLRRSVMSGNNSANVILYRRRWRHKIECTVHSRIIAHEPELLMDA